MKKLISGLIIITVCGIMACNKENTLADNYIPVTGEHTNIKFLQLSPGAPELNFYVNGLKTSAVLTLTGATKVLGLTYSSLFPSTIGYATLPPGSLKIEAKVTDSSTVLPGAVLLTATQTFAANKFYTFALVDTFTKVSYVAVEDDPTIPDETKSYLRVANFIADSAINVVITKTSSDYPYSKTYTNVAPKTVLAFDSLGAGTGQIYKIEMKRASNNATLVTLINFTPSKTKKYTFYARGLMRLPLSNTSGPTVNTYTNF
jgi:hypothetical protein